MQRAVWNKLLYLIVNTKVYNLFSVCFLSVCFFLFDKKINTSFFVVLLNGCFFVTRDHMNQLNGNSCTPKLKDQNKCYIVWCYTGSRAKREIKLKINYCSKQFLGNKSKSSLNIGMLL